MIDPSLSLKVQVPHFDDPLANYAKIAQVRNLLTQGQLHQQQIANEQEQLRGAQLKNQETERAQTAQRALADLLSKNTSQGANGEPQTDHFAVIKGLTDAGYAKEAAGYDTQRRADLKSELDNEKLKHENAKALTGQIASIFGPVHTAETPEQAAAMYPSAVARARQLPGVDPKSIPDQYDKNFVAQEVNGAVDADKQIDNRQKVLEFTQRVNEAAPKTTKEWQDIAFNQGSAARSQQELDDTKQALKLNGAPPAILAQLPVMWSQTAADALAQKSMTAEQRATLAGQAVTRTETANQHAATNRNETSRINLERQNVSLRQKQFDATYGALLDVNGKPLEPEAAKAVAMQDPTAVGIANYQLDPPNASRGGPGAGILRKVMAINPDYDVKDYQNQKKTLQAFTTGKPAQEMSAAAVALGHLGVMKEAIDGLNNGDIRILNSVANRLGLETGSSPAAVFRTIVHRVGPELTKAYVAGGGGQGERGTTEADFDPNLGPQVLKDNVAVTAKLLEGKLDQQKKVWTNTFPNRPFPAMNAGAEAARASLGGASNGSGLAVGQTVTLKTGKKVKVTAVHSDGTFDAE